MSGRARLAIALTAIVLAALVASGVRPYALLLGRGADEFLGTQGDPWDTQSDIFMALLGAAAAVLLLARWHDARMAKLPPR